MGDGNGEHVKVVFDIDVHHVHEWERLRGLDGGRKRTEEEEGMGEVALRGRKRRRNFHCRRTGGRTETRGILKPKKGSTWRRRSMKKDARSAAFMFVAKSS